MITHEDIVVTRDVASDTVDPKRVVLHSDLKARIIESTEMDLQTDAGGNARDRTLATRFRFPARNNHGGDVDMQAGDALTYRDYRGVEQRRLVTRVRPVYFLGRLDHIFVEATR